MGGLFHNSAGTLGGQLWLIVLLAGILLAILLMIPQSRRLIRGKFNKAIDKQNAKDPEVVFNEVIRELSQDYQERNLLAAQAHGRVKELETEAANLRRDIDSKNADAVFVKKQKGADHEETIDAYTALDQLEERYHYIVGDPSAEPPVPSALERAKAMAAEASNGVKDIEREIKAREEERKTYVSMAKDAAAQEAIYTKLQKYGPNSHSQQLDRLKQQIQENANTATGLGMQYESSYDVRQARNADEARRARAMERAKNPSGAPVPPEHR